MNIIRKLKRRKLFDLAQKRSKKTGKKLLVIGNPSNGVANSYTGNDYDCGDVCIDIAGCSCKNGARSITSSLEDVIINNTVNFDDYIIFISCTLEYVSDLPLVLSKLNKIDAHDIFVVSIEPYCLAAYLYFGFFTDENNTNYVIYSAPPTSDTIVYGINPLKRYNTIFWIVSIFTILYILNLN